MENEKQDKPDNPLRKEGAKVYLVEQGLIARVVKVESNEVHVKGGNKEYPRELSYSEYEFDQLCGRDAIVAQSQAQFNDNGEYVGVKGKPKEIKKPTVKQPKKKEVKKEITEEFEEGWINEKTGKFSKEKKRGYTQIQFKRVKKKVELELDESQLQKLKELGILKE